MRAEHVSLYRMSIETEKALVLETSHFWCSKSVRKMKFFKYGIVCVTFKYKTSFKRKETEKAFHYSIMQQFL